MLPAIIKRIVAMLADEADRIHGQQGYARRQSVLDAVIYLKAMPLSEASAEIQEPSDNQGGVGVELGVMRIHRDDSADAFPGRLRLNVEAGSSPGRQKLPPVHPDRVHYRILPGAAKNRRALRLNHSI